MSLDKLVSQNASLNKETHAQRSDSSRQGVDNALHSPQGVNRKREDSPCVSVEARSVVPGMQAGSGTINDYAALTARVISK